MSVVIIKAADKFKCAPAELWKSRPGRTTPNERGAAMSITYVRKIKKVEDIKIGDWYEGSEVKAVKNWSFAVDIHLDNGVVKMHEAGLTVVVSVPKNEVNR